MRQLWAPKWAGLGVGLDSLEKVLLGGLGTGFRRMLSVLEGVGLEPGKWMRFQSGQVFGLGPESTEGVWLGTFWRLRWIVKWTGKKGDSGMGRA